MRSDTSRAALPDAGPGGYAGAMKLLHTAHVPPGEGPFPTILVFHGFGASAHDLFSLSPFLHGGGALVLCPQGPVAYQLAPEQAPGLVGYSWWPQETNASFMLGHLEDARKLVDEFLEEAQQRYPIDPRKIVVLGFSQGGILAYDQALRSPERFAGLVALSSVLPDALDKSIPSQDALENFPALIIHGSKDPLIPVSNAQESRQALLRRRLNVQYQEYPMQHEISQEALVTLVKWLEERVFNLIQLA